MDDRLTCVTNQDPEDIVIKDRLSIYRESVGIVDTISKGNASGHRILKNVGLYRRVVNAEHKAHLQYSSAATMINICLLIQIIFAAILTSLGALNGPHTAIMAIGALNTVIAAFLAFTDGRGQPTHLRQYRDALRKVRERIEQRERDVSSSECKMNIAQEIREIGRMYRDVRVSNEVGWSTSYHALAQSCRGNYGFKASGA